MRVPVGLDEPLVGREVAEELAVGEELGRVAVAGAAGGVLDPVGAAVDDLDLLPMPSTPSA